MIDNHENTQNKRSEYRERVKTMGKKEFTLLKMQEYGFWPKDLPTPYERQKNETIKEYEERQKLLKKYNKIIEDIGKLYKEKDDINAKLRQLRKEYNQTWDYEKIRLDVSKKIMQESIARRAERKKQKELEKKQRSEAWNKKKSEEIVYIGQGCSSVLNQRETIEEKLLAQGLPIIKSDKDLAQLLGIEYKQLRFLAYHRDVVSIDHYNRYTVPKKKGGFRNIAAPKSTMKYAQRKILEEILSKISISDYAHGFLKGKSVITGAEAHIKQPELLINMDIKEFFPTITFQRVRGMFKSFGYSPYIASLLAVICTYCERVPIEVRGKTKYVKTSERILPQGSPASPMITNILCINLDKRLNGLANKYGFAYTRYADDMSFSLRKDNKLEETNLEIRKFCGLILKIISEEGFTINKSKTRFLKKNNCQSITGIVINNNEIGVPRKWVKRLRAAVHNANKLKMNEGKVPSKVINEISGMVAWVKSVNANRYKDIINDAMKVIN